MLLDGVFNHVGRRFPMFQQALRGGRAHRLPNGSPLLEGRDREPGTSTSRGIAIW